MKVKCKQSGITLMEMTVVIAIVAVFTVFGLPAIRAFFKSFESRGGAKAMISAVLSSARAIAAKEQKYAGIRFQKAYHPEGPLKASQYMIFIVHEEPSKMTGLTIGFRAVEGLEPIKLPDSIGLMDLRINYNDKVLLDSDVVNDDDLTDVTTFSIIFSPSGKLVIHDVQVWNKDGVSQPSSPNQSKDDIFNSEQNIANYSIGMFIQDDYDLLGLDKEPSRNSFIIYDKTQFENVDENKRYSGYLKDLEVIYINPYTGTMIKR